MMYPKQMRSVIIFLIMGACCFIVLSILTGVGEGRTIVVDDVDDEDADDGTSSDYSEIRFAVENSSVGDTILVKEGNYSGTIWINHSLELIGDGWNSTTIDGNGTIYSIYVHGDGVQISGFRFINSKRAIGMESNNSRILNNSFSLNNTYGLEIIRSKDITIEGNQFTDCVAVGVAATNSRSVFVRNNDFQKNGYGVSYIYVKGSSVRNNHFRYHSTAVYLDFSEDVKVRDNSIVNNTRTGIFVMYSHCEDIDINDNYYGENRYDIRLYGQDEDEGLWGNVFVAFSVVVISIMIITTLVVLLLDLRSSVTGSKTTSQLSGTQSSNERNPPTPPASTSECIPAIPSSPQKSITESIPGTPPSPQGSNPNNSSDSSQKDDS